MIKLLGFAGLFLVGLLAAGWNQPPEKTSTVTITLPGKTVTGTVTVFVDHPINQYVTVTETQPPVTQTQTQVQTQTVTLATTTTLARTTTLIKRSPPKLLRGPCRPPCRNFNGRCHPIVKGKG